MITRSAGGFLGHFLIFSPIQPWPKTRPLNTVAGSVDPSRPESQGNTTAKGEGKKEGKTLPPRIHSEKL